jgi:pimeloyl-ACP methyl ester carboxylesterase
VRELTVGAPELHGHQQCGHGLPPSVADVAFAEWTSGTSSTCGALQVASKRRKPSGEALATGRVSDATVDGVGAASSAFRLERTPLREARAYRAFDVTLAQSAQRKRRPLTMPVLAIGGAASWGDRVGEAMKPLADEVQSVVIAGAGHWGAEEAPEEMLAALTTFLAPYRDGAVVADCRTLASA